MAGTITFVGAGPGAPDLITLRGVEALKRADLVIYAGSLVNEQLLDYAPPAARRVNSAGLDFTAVIAEIKAAYEAGKAVVRLHTGDPAMYGAVAEQYRELDRLGLPYSVVPGVSSVFAAAAALKTEFTMPGLSQSAILTRDAGRTPVPDGEALEKLAACGCTLCIFLSVAGIRQLTQKLLAAGRSPQTPAAVVYRASWPNEIVVRGTVADIAGKVEAAGIKRQSIIIVGEVLERSGELSSLYNKHFAHGYRTADPRDGFHGRCALFALSAKGTCKAVEIAAGLGDEAKVFVPEKHAHLVPCARLETYPEGGFADAYTGAWKRFDALVMVMAAGIVVRHAAKLCRSKLHDPAVVVCDEAGDYAVSLLSGHLGGANRLARAIAGITGGKPVITTATDVRKLMAFDELAARFRYRLLNPKALVRIATAMLDGEALELTMPPALFQNFYADNPEFRYQGASPDGAIQVRHAASDTVLRLEKLRYAVGVGCRRNAPAEEIAAAVDAALETAGLVYDDIGCFASIDLKQDEAGLLEAAKNAGKTVRFFTAAELNRIEVPHPSLAAREKLGVNSVSEAAALLAAGPGAQLVLDKQIHSQATVAIAEVKS